MCYDFVVVQNLALIYYQKWRRKEVAKRTGKEEVEHKSVRG